MEVFIKTRLAPLLVLGWLFAAVFAPGAQAGTISKTYAHLAWDSIAITLENPDAVLGRNENNPRGLCRRLR